MTRYFFLILFAFLFLQTFGQKKIYVLETLNTTKYPNNIGKYSSTKESLHEAKAKQANPLLFDINQILSKKNDKFKEMISEIKDIFTELGFNYTRTKLDIEDELDMYATIYFDDVTLELSVEDTERDLEMVFTDILYYNWFADKLGHSTNKTDVDRLSDERKIIISYWGKEKEVAQARDVNSKSVPATATIAQPSTAIPKPYIPSSVAANNTPENGESADNRTSSNIDASCQNNFRKYTKFSTDEMPNKIDVFTNKFNEESGVYVDYIVKKMEEKGWLIESIGHPMNFGRDNYYRSRNQYITFKKGEKSAFVNFVIDLKSDSDSLVIEKRLAITTSDYPSEKGSEFLKENFTEDFNDYYVNNGSNEVDVNDINKILLARSLDCYKKYISGYSFKSNKFIGYTNTMHDLYTLRNEETVEAYLHNAAMYDHEIESSSENNRKNQKYWLDKAVAKGNGNAMLQLGRFYKKYFDIPDAQDINKSIFWFQKATEHNQVEGYFELSMIYKLGVVQIGSLTEPSIVLVKEDLEIAKDYYKKYIKATIETKNALMINYFSEKFKVGDVLVDKDLTEAARLKKLACELDKKFCN